MTTPEELKQKLAAFQKASNELSTAWENCSDDFADVPNKMYPLNESFGDFNFKVTMWVKDTVKRIDQGKKVYIVLLNLFGGNVQPIFRSDDLLMIFNTQAEALAEIRDCVKDTKEAVKEGNMDEAYKMGDYRTASAILKGDILTCSFNGVNYSMNRKDEDWTELEN
jgi:hypothetical protein